MEDLITVLIFFIIIGATIFRKIKTSQTKSGKTADKKNVGLSSMIKAFLTDLQEKMEQQSAQSRTNESEWHELMDESAISDNQSESLEDLVFEDVRDELAAGPPPKKSRLASEPTHPKAKKKTEKSLAPPSLGIPKPYPKVFPSPMALRKAIIWAEIIGPPVSEKPLNHDHW